MAAPPPRTEVLPAYDPPLSSPPARSELTTDWNCQAGPGNASPASTSSNSLSQGSSWSGGLAGRHSGEAGEVI